MPVWHQSYSKRDDSLSAATLSNKGDRRPCRDIQGKALENLELWAGGVGEGDVLELYVALYALRPLALFFIIYVRLPVSKKLRFSRVLYSCAGRIEMAKSDSVPAQKGCEVLGSKHLFPSSSGCDKATHCRLRQH